MAFLSEAQLETVLLTQAEREAYDEVVLQGRLGDAVARLLSAG